MTLKTTKLRAQLKRLFIPPDTKQFFSTKAQKYVFLNKNSKHPTFHVSTSATANQVPLPTLPEPPIADNKVTCLMDPIPPAMSTDSSTPSLISSPSADSDSTGNVPTAGQSSQKTLDGKDSSSKEVGSKSSFKGFMKRIRKASISKKKSMNNSSEYNSSEDYSSLEPSTPETNEIEETTTKLTKPPSFLNPSEEELHVEELIYILMDFAVVLFFLVLFIVVAILVFIRLEEEIDSIDWFGYSEYSNSMLEWIPSPL